MIDTFSKVAANCLHGAVLILIIVIAFGMILGGKRGAAWVINRTISLIKAALRASLIYLGRKMYSCLCYVGRYIYRLSRVNWLPSSRIRQHQSGMRIRIQRFTPTREQDSDLDSSRNAPPQDIDWE